MIEIKEDNFIMIELKGQTLIVEKEPKNLFQIYWLFLEEG